MTIYVECDEALWETLDDAAIDELVDSFDEAYDAAELLVRDHAESLARGNHITVRISD